jgi:hypothetical protein
MDFG